MNLTACRLLWLHNTRIKAAGATHVDLDPVLVDQHHPLDGGRVVTAEQERLSEHLVHEVDVLPAAEQHVPHQGRLVPAVPLPGLAAGRGAAQLASGVAQGSESWRLEWV